jgi:alpha-galactosidase
MNRVKPQPRDEKMMILDPSVPDVLAHVRESVRGLAAWGFELIKHDFSTFDIFGRWGFEMAALLTSPGWHLADRDKTTAEIVLGLYKAIREGAGSALVIGCNTIGHLAAGLFELQRTGDDTSGKEWGRTRKMGVNTLAFRMPQHNAFFASDADCVGLTTAIPWELNRQWLDLLARSGTPLFVSTAPDAMGAPQRAALKSAFASAAKVLPPGEPLDWLDTTTPREWVLAGKPTKFDWIGDEVSALPLR